MSSSQRKLMSNSEITATARISVVTAEAEPGSIGFSYSLPSSARTSAAVYDSSDRLIRTLWSNQEQTLGPHIARWDGLADDGTHSPDGNYKLKLLYNNVQYQWSVIGDTSRTLEGPNNGDTQASFPTDAAYSGKYSCRNQRICRGTEQCRCFQRAGSSIALWIVQNGYGHTSEVCSHR